MRTPVLMTVRVPYRHAERILESPGVLDFFKKTVYVTVDEPPPHKAIPFSTAIVHGKVDISRREEACDFLEGVIRMNGVTHAVISQPLLWYSDEAARACHRHGVEVIWFEKFPGGKGIFDKIGCQYMAESEISTYSQSTRILFPNGPEATAASQPKYCAPSELLSRYGVDSRQCIVLFGQSHIDMAVADTHDRLGYEEWVKGLVDTGLPILYKRHPVYEAIPDLPDPLQWILKCPAVQAFPESIFSAFDAFSLFASYSSTVILEGALRGRFFITGGRHFIDSYLMCLRIREKDGFRGLPDLLLGFEPNWKELVRRLGFVTRLYTIDFKSPALLEKLTLSSDDYYGRYRERIDA